MGQGKKPELLRDCVAGRKWKEDMQGCKLETAP